MRFVMQVAPMGEKVNARKIMVGDSKGKSTREEFYLLIYS
jgi:hypothetical protein